MLKVGWMPEGPNGEKQGVDDLLAKGATIEDLEHYLKPFTGHEIVSEGWPSLDEEAYYGLTGKIIKQILPHTEADAPALLFSFLVYVGCMVGRGAHFKVEGDTHYLKNNVVLVGKTAKGRKGVSQGRIDELMMKVDPNFVINNIKSGLSSGEGLIENVRDAKVKHKEDGLPETVDEGISDKRLLVAESEFGSPLTIMRREGNILSMVIRNLWDDKVVSTLTRNNPLKSTGSHVSILGHVTQRELKRHLTEEKLGAGFANRFLFAMVHRSKSLPHGGEFDPVRPTEVAALKEAINYGSKPREVPLGFEPDPEHGLSTLEMWEEVYPGLSEGDEGLLGSITSRAEAHVRRIATIYAVLDKSPTVSVDHLLAGLAVWQYAEDSARHLFGDLRGDEVADEIVELLKIKEGEGATKWEINNHFSGHKNTKRLTAAIKDLLEAGLIIEEVEKREGPGRKTRRYYVPE